MKIFIWLQIDQGRLLVEAKCSCKAGSVGKCKHTAAVIHSLNNFQDDTPTSGPCQWTIPKKTKDYSQGVTIATLFPSKMDSVNILGIHPTSLLETFQHLQCPLMTVLQKERDLSSLSPASMSCILFLFISELLERKYGLNVVCLL